MLSADDMTDVTHAAFRQTLQFRQTLPLTTPSSYRIDKSTIWIPEEPAAVEKVAAKLNAVVVWPKRERP